MTFGLKNAGATYQAMNFIFHDIVGKTVEIYIDDAVVKSKGLHEHLVDLRRTLGCTRKYGLKLNPQLVSSPVLIPPQKHKPFKLYLSNDECAIGSVLIQEFEGNERMFYYISRRLLDVETRFSPTKKLCLCLYFTCTKV